MEDDEETRYLVNDTGEKVQRVQDIKARVQRQDWAVFKSRLSLKPSKTLSGYQKWNYRRRVAWRKVKIRMGDLAAELEIWGKALKTIEGHFGSGVLSYFVFLKWMFMLNLYIFTLVFFFIVVPQITANMNTAIVNVGNLSDLVVNQSIYCSDQYVVPVASNDPIQLIMDFIQGSGWMEQTMMFYGAYTDSVLSMDELFGSSSGLTYNMPLAYLLITIIYFGLSLVLMMRHTSETLRERLLHAEDWARARGYISVTFSGWDYTLTDHEPTVLRHKHIYNEIMANIDEECQKMRRSARDQMQKIALFFIRMGINLLVAILLGVAAYLIYVATTLSTEFSASGEYATAGVVKQIFYDYVPSLTITALNFLLPKVFAKIVKVEDFEPEVEIRWTLGRTVFLRLASLCVLFATLYDIITCSDQNECGVGINECPEIWCWETYVGQQIYRLMITFVAVLFGVIFFVEFPRKFIVSKVNIKVVQMVGYPTFDLPKNVLDLVYCQILVWIGVFFAPMLAVFSFILFWAMFYLKRLTTMYNYVPEERPYRSSKSHVFFMIVLIISYLLCCVPIGFCIYSVRPSVTCGPFRLYPNMWSVLPDMVATWPTGLQTICTFLASAAFLIPLFIVMCLVIYIQSSASQTKGELAGALQEQLSMSSKDRQFLLTRLNEFEGEHGRRGADTVLPSEKAAAAGGRSGQPNYNTMSAATALDAIDVPGTPHTG